MSENKASYMIKRDHLILLVGASGSGKTAVAKEMEKRGYNVIQSYTTREPRHENEWGHTFVSQMDQHCLSNLKRNEELIAYTFYNGHHYWATKNQISGPTFYIIDPAGIESLVKNNWYPRHKTTIIYLNASRDTRYSRMAYQQRRPPAAIRDRLAVDEVEFIKVRADWILDADDELENVLSMVQEITDAIVNVRDYEVSYDSPTRPIGEALTEILDASVPRIKQFFGIEDEVTNDGLSGYREVVAEIMEDETFVDYFLNMDASEVECVILKSKELAEEIEKRKIKCKEQ